MKKLFSLWLITATLLFASVNVVTSYAYIADIVKRIGQERVEVRALSKGYFDPHFIVAKPSHIGKIKQADLLFKNGGELEIGWLPPLIDRAYNSRLIVVDLSLAVTMIEVPEDISRAYGDIHAQGNPHYHLDPDNILLLAKAVLKALKEHDPRSAESYQKNFEQFQSQWLLKIKEWDAALKPLKGQSVLSYHKLFSYFHRHFGLRDIINIEPLPGITPSASHIQKIIAVAKEEKPRFIISDVYHAKKIPDFISGATGVPVAILPHDVGSLEGVETLEDIFDTMVKALIHD